VGQHFSDTSMKGLRDVGLEQVCPGYGLALQGPRTRVRRYKEYQHEQTTQDRLVYRDEEQNAKASQVGLWKDAKPVPPWAWRKQSMKRE
jgi:endonuclease YncB( thermonuclease family)